MKNLKRLRAEKGLSQQKVADAIGSTQQSIHRYENGDYEPDIQTLSLLAGYFETSIDFLVGRTDERKKVERVEKYALNHDESKVVDELRNLPPEYKKLFNTMFNGLVEFADKAK